MSFPSFREALLDNPIIRKHARSRLRRGPLFSSAAMVVVMCGFLLWLGIQTHALFTSGGVSWLLFLQGIIIFVAATSQVATVVAHAKDSGIIDFHRISPVRPSALMLGFVLGSAIREWVLLACTLPFAAVLIACGAISPGGYLLILLDMVLVAVLYHTMAVLVGLVSAKPRNVSGGVVALVFVCYTMGAMFATSFPALPTILPTVSEAMDWGRSGLLFPAATFYGLKLPAFAQSLLHQLPLLGFLFIAGIRKMRSDRAYLYSKPLAIAFQLLIALLAVGDVIGPGSTPGEFSQSGAAVTVTYVLTVAGIVLISTVTPTAGDFANGVLRAKKQGQSRAPLMSDLAANWAPLAALSLLVLGGAFAAAALIRGAHWSGPLVASAFVGACAVYYYGCARQAFDLMFRKNSPSFLALTIFLLWLLPLVVGGIAAAADLNRSFYQTVLGLSPLAGIAMVVYGSPGGGLSGPAGMAISSSILFAIAFTQLRIQAERRAAEGIARGMRDEG